MAKRLVGDAGRAAWRAAQNAERDAAVLESKRKAVAIAKCRNDFYFYSRWMMLHSRGVKWVRGNHHLLICNALMRVYRGECKRLIINIPPRYSKTQLVTNFIAWTLGRHPDSEYIYLSYSGGLAIDKTSDALRDVESAAYKEIFPDVRLITTAAGHWKTDRGGVVYAAGTEGTITGFGAGKKREGFGGFLGVDDPHKPDEVFGIVREKVIANFQRTVENRLNQPMHTPIILIMQCLHEEDLSAYLKEGRNGEVWDVLSLPAINMDGTALWPEMHSIERLHKMRGASPYNFSGQYMQAPTPVGGAYFQERLFLVDGKPVEFPERIDFVFAVIDTAMKTGNQHDGTGVTYFGLATHGQVDYPLYVLDWDIQQIEGGMLETWLPSVFERMEYLAAECKALYGARHAWIEDKGSGTVLLQQAANHGWPAQPIDTKLTSMGKSERAYNAEPYVAKEMVKMTRQAYEKTTTYKGRVKNHWLSQVMSFSLETSDPSQADDLLDTMTYGISLSIGNNEGF